MKRRAYRFTIGWVLLISAAGIPSPQFRAQNRLVLPSQSVARFATAPRANAALSPKGKANPAGQARLVNSYGKLPLSFEANQGQTDAKVKFLARGGGYTLFLTGDEAVLGLQARKSKVSPRRVADLHGDKSQKSKVESAELFQGRFSTGHPSVDRPSPRGDAPPSATDFLKMKLMGANANVRVSGIDLLPGKTNYFIGNDPKKWRTNVPNYRKVKYENVYPGVDLVYYGSQSGQLEYDFVVAPGADPKVIALDVGAALPAVAALYERRSDDIGVSAGHKFGGHRPPPQNEAPLRIAANGDLVIKADGGEIRFQKPIVYQQQSAVESQQLTVRKNHPELNSYNPISPIENRQFIDGHYLLDAENGVRFEVASYDYNKPLIIDPVLIYSTYLGGSGGDWGSSIAVDGSGNVYVTGNTCSADFPTANPTQATFGDGGCSQQSGSFWGDAFVTKLNPTGSVLLYSTYVGGSAPDYGAGIAVDSSGNAYVTGTTFSTDFPTVNPIQASCGCAGTTGGDAFVTKLNSAGNALVYSTYLGGSGDDWGLGIAVDGPGNAYITGFSGSKDFPIASPFQSANAGQFDAFAAKLNASGSALVYSTYLGGGSFDVGSGIAVDSAGNAYVTGYTQSTNFPTANPFQASCGNGCANQTFDAFVTKLNAIGSALVYSTYLGGSGEDWGNRIALDSFGNAYVAGVTYSTNFPSANPIQSTFGGGVSDAFVAKLNAAGNGLIYSTYLGGDSNDFGLGIAVDTAGDAYIIGSTYSTDFPTAHTLQGTNAAAGAGGSNAFVTEMNTTGSAFVYSTYLGGSTSDQGSGIALDAAGNVYVTGLAGSTDFPIVAPVQPTCPGCNGNAVNPIGDAFVVKISQADAPGADFTPSAINFGSQLVSFASPAKTLSLRNVGSATLSIGDISIAGANSGDFAQTNACGANLSGGVSCTISVTFTPSASGPRAASLTVTDDAGGSPQTASLMGTGAIQDLTISMTHSGDFYQGQTGAIYLVGVSNIEGLPTSGTVTVTATLPVGLAATAMGGTGWTCTLATLTCNRSDVLGGAASYPVITLTVNVAADVPASGTSTATVSGGGEFITTNDTASDLTTILQTPTADSVTPTPASGSTQTFSLAYSDQNTTGHKNLTYVRALINPRVIGAQGCYVLYYVPTNKLYLENDADTASLGPLTPGAPGTLANSQCTVNGTGTTVSGSGATLTLNLSLTGSSSFLGTRNIYMLAQDSQGLSSGWQNRGTWTPIGPDTAPTADSVTPTPASGANQTFSLTYSEHNGKGYADLTYVRALINPRVVVAQSCYVLYYQPANWLYLENDAGTGLLGPLALGTAGMLSNSQCTLIAAGTTVVGSGATLTLNLAVSASSSFLGTRNIYILAQDSEGSSSGWQNRGAWTPIGPDTAPTADSVTPTPASGASQTFSLGYSSQNGKGYTDLTWVSALFNWEQSGTNGCYVRYYQPANLLYLRNDAGTADLGPLTPGSAGTLSNSQCTVHGPGTTVSGSGNTLLLNLSLSASGGFVGPKIIYMWVIDSEGSTSGWQNRGNWVP
jgi:hypothetical protein